MDGIDVCENVVLGELKVFPCNFCENYFLANHFRSICRGCFCKKTITLLSPMDLPYQGS